jgi:hypothetical protein
MANINLLKLETPTEGSHGLDGNEHAQSKQNSVPNTESSCCENSSSYGYPAENPVVNICFTCGSWNWKNY